MSRRPVVSNVRVKFWLEDADGRAFFGGGIADLLRAIDKYKSIALACQRIGMSYRYALHKISIAEERSGRRLVDRFRGGRSKGGAKLTQQGRLLLERYLEAERVLDKLAESI
jgi:molybdate transport system regulatory protein